MSQGKVSSGCWDVLNTSLPFMNLPAYGTADLRQPVLKRQHFPDIIKSIVLFVVFTFMAAFCSGK